MDVYRFEWVHLSDTFQFTGGAALAILGLYALFRWRRRAYRRKHDDGDVPARPLSAWAGAPGTMANAGYHADGYENTRGERSETFSSGSTKHDNAYAQVHQQQPYHDHLHQGQQAYSGGSSLAGGSSSNLAQLSYQQPQSPYDATPSPSKQPDGFFDSKSWQHQQPHGHNIAPPIEPGSTNAGGPPVQLGHGSMNSYYSQPGSYENDHAVYASDAPLGRIPQQQEHGVENLIDAQYQSTDLPYRVSAVPEKRASGVYNPAGPHQQASVAHVYDDEGGPEHEMGDLRQYRNNRV